MMKCDAGNLCPAKYVTYLQLHWTIKFQHVLVVLPAIATVGIVCIQQKPLEIMEVSSFTVELSSTDYFFMM